MRVGIVGLWFERGNGYLTRGLRSLLLPGCRPFIYARVGYIVGKDGRVPHMEIEGPWDLPDVTRITRYGVDPKHCAQWILKNQLQAVIWNEEYNHDLVRQVSRLLGDHRCCQIAYLDWVGPENWVKALPTAYDHLLSATQRTVELLRDEYGLEVHRFQWGLDTGSYVAPTGSKPDHLFFHNAGWGGVNYRKGSLLLLRSWRRLFEGGSFQSPPGAVEPSLLFHTQKPLEEWPPSSRELLETSERIEVVEGTVPEPGLYHRARVYVGPSLLEGLGLTFPEALAAGLPLITTDAPPMNEHGDGSCAIRVPVGKMRPRQDGCAFPETHCSTKSLQVALRNCAYSKEIFLQEMGRRARKYAVQNLDLWITGPLFRELIRRLVSMEATARWT